LNSIQDVLNYLWSGMIKNHSIDLLYHKIEFEIEILNEGKFFLHYLKFSNVKSFYYLNDQEPFVPEDNDYLELSAVYYEREESKKIEVKSTKSTGFYRSTNPNFILEIWGREMYIEASSIEVDGIVYLID